MGRESPSWNKAGMEYAKVAEMVFERKGQPPFLEESTLDMGPDDAAEEEAA